MNFPVSSSIFDSLKSMKLNIKWQQRKENPLMAKGLNTDPKIADLQRQAENVRKSNVISGIDGKLKSGQELTNDELEYLRNNSPELYKKAIEVKKEREEYKRELEKCKTKEDVQRLNYRTMQNFMSEVNSIRGNANIPKLKKLELLDQVARRAMGIQSEHKAFVKSKDYAELPREAEIEEGKKEKKRDTVKKDDEYGKDISKELFDKINGQKDKLLVAENGSNGFDSGSKMPDIDFPNDESFGNSDSSIGEKPVVIYNAKGKITSASPTKSNGVNSAVTISKRA